MEIKIIMKRYINFHWFLALLFLTGIALTGSGSSWFPWANMSGIVLIGLSGLLCTGEKCEIRVQSTDHNTK